MSNSETLLNNVVAKLIAEQVEVLRLVTNDAFDQLSVCLFGVIFQTLLNDIAAELLFR